MVTLTLDRVGAAYGRQTILEGVSTPALQGGSLVALVGANGAGKSTLLRRLAGQLDGPGCVVAEHDGRPVEAARICYMPQDTTPEARLTVYESMILSLKNQSRGWRVSSHEHDEIESVLAMLGIAELGFRTMAELSGGQRQLAGLAQVLVRQPQILLLDEPTSALDLRRQMQFFKLIRQVVTARGMVCVASLHDLNQVMRFAECVLVLENRQHSVCGHPDVVLTPERLARVYGIEARIESCSRGQRHVFVDDCS